MVRILKPAVPYFGAKWKWAEWILGSFPPHQQYVDLCGGSGAMIFAKAPAPVEIYCDIYEPACNFMEVLKGNPAELIETICRFLDEEEDSFLLRDPLNVCQEGHLDGIEMAAQFYCYSHLSWSGGGTRWSSGRGSATREDAHPYHLWACSDRLRCVSIHRESCFDLLGAMPKDPSILYYLDPPYIQSARKSKDNRAKNPQQTASRRQYACEFSDKEHIRALKLLKGRSAIVSGYPSELYEKHKPKGWTAISKRIGNECEYLWLSPEACDRIPQLSLFDLKAI